MAKRKVQLDEETFSCSICLDLLKDPVTIPCGHSYCMICIQTDWGEENERRTYRCPQCRKTFSQRPVLVKNTMLADLVEKLKKTSPQAAPDDHCFAGPEDVACDVCTERKLKAKKSCLVCLVSYCEKHLQPHYDVPQLGKHKLVEPSKNLQENICSHHDEVKKMFCRTDQQSVCYLCSVEEHKDHDTVSAVAEVTERKKELQVSLQQILERVQDRRQKQRQCEWTMYMSRKFANLTQERCTNVLTELIQVMQKRKSDVEQQIRLLEEAEVSPVKDYREKLLQEITELERKAAELEQLSHTEDHINFLHNYRSVSDLSETPDSSREMASPNTTRYFVHILKAVSEFRGNLQDNMRQFGTKVDILPPDPETRAGFLQYSCELTLDPNTANEELTLLEQNRKVMHLEEQPHCYPPHPDRFMHTAVVLSRESLTGRCYWEVEMFGPVYVGVSYNTISRTGIIREFTIGRAGDFNECTLGRNDKSWALESSQSVYHNNIPNKVSGPVSSRIGVYLDHKAGVLSFYNVSDTMTLIYRYETAFTQPLYAAFQLDSGNEPATVTLCNLK